MGKVSFIALVFLVSLACCQVDDLEGITPCLYRKQGLVWNVAPLRNDQGYYTVQDPIVPLNSVDFNFCKQVKCGDKEAYAVLNRLETWSTLTDDTNNPIVSIIDKESLSLLFNYTGEEKCVANPSQKYSFEVKLLCKEDSDFKFTRDENEPWRIIIQKNTKSGCPIIKANAIWNFFEKYRMYLTPAVIVVGLFFLIVGAYFYRITVFLTVLITSIFAVMVVLYAFILPFNTPEWTGWIVLVGSAVAGLVIASLTTTFLKIGVFLVGWWLGGMLATWLFQLFVYKISSEPLVLWIMIAVFALVLALISLKFLKLVLVLGTSFIGSFLIVRGVSFYLGGYPNEFQLFNEIQAGDIDNVPWTAYLYVAVMVVLAILGIFFQHKKFKIFSGKSHSTHYQKVED